MNKKMKIILISILAVFLSQTFLFNNAYLEYKNYKNKFTTLQHNSNMYDEILLDKIIRPQQRYMLSAIRQSWIKSSENDSMTSLLKTINNNIVYCNEKKEIIFDDSMTIKRVSENKFDIYDMNGNLVLKNASPQWNEEHILNILNTIMSPLKPFGNKGGFLVIDSYNGNVIVDTSSDNRLKKSLNYNIYDDINLSENKDKDYLKKSIDNFLQRKDSDNFSQYIYLKNEKNIQSSNENDFSKYPLGESNRQFVEKIILPYEMIGVEGQPMQLTILAVVDEQDISKDYSLLKQDVKEMQDGLDKNLNHMVNLIVYLMCLSFLMLIVTVLTIVAKKEKEK